MKRVVIDTGVVVSALLKKEGTSRRAFTKAASDCTPLLALDTLVELEKTLSKPKFEKFFSWQERISLVEFLIRHGEFVEITSDLSACRDDSDNKFLNLAVDGKADAILTRNPDLLALHPCLPALRTTSGGGPDRQAFNGIPILSPADFLKKF